MPGFAASTIIIGLTLPDGNHLALKYDEFSRLIEETDPLDRTIRYKHHLACWQRTLGGLASNRSQDLSKTRKIILHIEAEKEILRLSKSLYPAEIFVGKPTTQHDVKLLEYPAEREFLATLPRQYIGFLSRCDGVASGGVFIHSSRPHRYPDSDSFSHDFLGPNKIARELESMKSHQIFGESDQDEYVLDVRSKKYQVRAKQAYDNVFEELDCFDDILCSMVDLIVRRS